MRRLRDTSVAPPEFFTYVHPESGHKTQAMDYRSWIIKCIEDRKANGWPVPDDFELQAQDQLCQTLPPDLWEIDSGDKSWVNTRLNWDDVLRGTKTYLQWRKEGKPFVKPEEAERRASICNSCYLNVRIAGCGGFCREVTRIVTETKGEHKTSYDANLLNCACCKCTNASQIWFPLTLLESNDTPQLQDKYPLHCWKSHQSANYRPEE